MDQKRLPDTPWHVGFVKKEEDDPRRHKSRCVHILKGKCTYGHSGCYELQCAGSSHCKFYAENAEHWDEVYQNTKTIEQAFADNDPDAVLRMLYGKHSKKVNTVHGVQVEIIDESKPHIFLGTEIIEMKDIKLTPKFSAWKPNDKALIEEHKYYQRNKKFSKPIKVDLEFGKYVIKGNFLQFYVARQIGVKRIRAKMSND